MELARTDPSIATFSGVHSGLSMGTIYLCGNHEQKQRYLPASLGHAPLEQRSRRGSTMRCNRAAAREVGEYAGQVGGVGDAQPSRALKPR